MERLLFLGVNAKRGIVHHCTSSKGFTESLLIALSTIKTLLGTSQCVKVYPIDNESVGAFLGWVKAVAALIRAQPFDPILRVTHGHMIRELLNHYLRTVVDKFKSLTCHEPLLSA